MTEIVLLNETALPSRRELARKIDNLPIAAEGKLALHGLSTTIAEVAGRIVEVGRRIVAFAFELMKQFPNLSLALLAAVTINALLLGVPLLGPLLQPLYGPLVLAASVGLGAVAELSEGDMRPRVEKVVDEFRAIFA